ncbi:enoyl-CoA hydratase/isomerase family protein [Roseomonas gilardii]|uniref:enoyl-CoA hydratase/isomerase family protein n=1 Tax=Roseomonas gilardii TaxID=257708 RepID=UPI000E02FE78|nr:enoyl-CoA hydratase/isomerase family protein [Roseomonas gilardii]SUE44888.1 Carnitinyl-CoA dehydratase [Roseomonas gilardii subsp. rosea]
MSQGQMGSGTGNAMGNASGIATRIEGAAGVIQLDRPKALNALDQAMIDALAEALRRFGEDPSVRLVLLEGLGGRAFCAGGDIRFVRQAVLDGRGEEADHFFATEYALNGAIAAFPKPWVSLIDGICMGGGIGVSLHGSHRVVTERALLAMPETAIGFFPDVGTSHCLPRLEGAIGNWLGLTGARLRGAEAVEAGLATHYCPAEELPALRQALLQGDAEAAITAHTRPAPHGAVTAQAEAIYRCFAAGTVPHILEALEAEGTGWAAEQIATLRRMSPMSLCVTRELFRIGGGHDLATCLETELALARRVIRQPDFAEGVRAVVVDKDQSPRWHPARIEEVEMEAVRALLAP